MAGRSNPKRDPRLDYLAGLAERALLELHEAERHALAGIAVRLSKIAPPRDAGDDLSRYHDERRTVRAKLFAPLTAGVFLPRGRRAGHASGDAREGFAEPTFSVFINSEADDEDLARLGVMPRSRSAEVHTAFLPRSRLRDVDACAGVGFVELGRPWFYDLNEAIPIVGIATWHGADPPLKGDGVIVGVIDNVIDIHHRAFRTAALDTRIAFLWDQTLTPLPGERGPPTAPALPGFVPRGRPSYGVEYDADAINSELRRFAQPGGRAYDVVRHAPVIGTHGGLLSHGTAVAGCAAGSLVDGKCGAAPGSSIIFVSPLDYDAGTRLVADNAAVLDGCAYIFARAQQLGRPCVINVSMGDNQGPHDGTTAGERFLDNLLTTPGRAITLSAGNATNTNAHAAGRIGPGERKVLELKYEPGASQSDVIEIWYDGHDRFAVEVTPPQGGSLGRVDPGAEISDVPVGGVTVTVTSALDSPRNRDNQISIIIAVPPQRAIPAGTWRIALTALATVNGTFHAWIDRNNRGLSQWLTDADEGAVTLGVPATARRPITVGNHSKQVPPRTLAGVDMNSGLGPTRDGRIKPEITAIGTKVFAPMAQDRNSPPIPALFNEMSGTSFAAPIVAGACALLFQRRGKNATCAEIKHLLMQSAGKPDSIVIPSNGFGFGFLQLMDMLVTPAPSKPWVDVWLKKDASDNGGTPFQGAGLAASPDIELLDTAKHPAAPRYAPALRYNSIVRVTVRNRGTEPARNTTVYLYWTDPARWADATTPEAALAAWHRDGIFVEPDDYVVQSNRVVLPVLGSGATAEVCFAWAPPDPAGSRNGDGRFRLLACAKQELDGGRRPVDEAAVAASNNHAMLDVRVVP